MKKTALVLSLLFFVQLPLMVVGGMIKEPEAVLTFNETKPTATVTPLLPAEEEGFLAAGTVDQYLAGGMPGVLVDSVKPETDSVDQPKEDEVLPETDDTLPQGSGEDKGFAGDAQIDSDKPILQKPSGTVVQGYCGPSKYKLTAAERDLVERVVMKEVSGRSYVDAMAVAQTIYDRSVDWGKKVKDIIDQPYQFAEPTYRWEPTDTVKQAVSDVFDRGHRLTKEKMYYYYAVRTAQPLCFHESQRCLVETKLHRYFGPW